MLSLEMYKFESANAESAQETEKVWLLDCFLMLICQPTGLSPASSFLCPIPILLVSIYEHT